MSLIQRILLGFGLVTACAVALSISASMSQRKMEVQFDHSAVELTQMLEQTVDLGMTLQNINRLTLVHANTKEAERLLEVEADISQSTQYFASQQTQSIEAFASIPELADRLKLINSNIDQVATQTAEHIVVHHSRLDAYAQVFKQMDNFNMVWDYFDSEMSDVVEEAKSSDDFSIKTSVWVLNSLQQEAGAIGDQLGKLVGITSLPKLIEVETKLVSGINSINKKVEQIFKKNPQTKDALASYFEQLEYQITDPQSLFQQYKTYLTLNLDSEERLISNGVLVSQVLDDIGVVTDELRSLSQGALVESKESNQFFFWLNVSLIAFTMVTALFVSFSVVKAIRSPLKDIQFALMSMAKGDLTYKISNSYKSELGDIANNINDLTTNLNDLMQDIKQTDKAVNEFSHGAQQKSQHILQQVQEQQEQSDSMATAVTEMEQAVQEVTNSAVGSSESVSDVVNVAQQNIDNMQSNVDLVGKLHTSLGKATDTMSKLSQQSQQIDEILTVIQSISEQTNLLALNAAIEAARAGEHGRGFAVVADEVRTLATRTQSSANEIGSMIESLQLNAKQAVDIVNGNLIQAEESVNKSNQSHHDLLSMIDSLHQIDDMSRSIASASEEQSSVTTEVAKNIVLISDVSKQIAQNADDSSDTISQLRQLSEKQSALLAKFQLA
jgi:methyl-accepting chemotaxis protein